MFVLASTLDTQGARNYIPLFDRGTTERYEAAGLVEISSALKKWNLLLRHDFGSLPLGCDVLLRMLLKVPKEMEQNSGTVFLGDLMERFASEEESKRLEKAMSGLQGKAERHHRWRVWRTSILLC